MPRAESRAGPGCLPRDLIAETARRSTITQFYQATNQI